MKLKLITDNNEEIELDNQQLDLSKDYCNIVAINFSDYDSETLLKIKKTIENYLPNVLIINKGIEVKQVKIEK